MGNHGERTIPETLYGSHCPLMSAWAPPLPSWTWWHLPPSPCSGALLCLDVKVGAGQPAGAGVWTHTGRGVGGCLAPGPRPDFSFHLQIINPALQGSRIQAVLSLAKNLPRIKRLQPTYNTK